MWHDQAGPGFAGALLDAARAKPAGVIGPNGKASDTRFNVYRNNVTHSLVEALSKNYPAVKAQCGNDKFSDAARLYLDAHPPRTKIMFKLGEGFSDWLDGFTPAKTQMPWLPDLARLERIWLSAYHAEDAAPLTPQSLGAIHPDQLGTVGFLKHPSTQLVQSQYAIKSMLEAGRNNLASNPQGPESVLVTRPQFAVELHLLTSGAAEFIDHILNGAPLNQAIEAALSIDPSFDLSAGFGILLQSGATTALT